MTPGGLPRYTRGKAGHTADCGPMEASQGVLGVGNHPQVTLYTI